MTLAQLISEICEPETSAYGRLKICCELVHRVHAIAPESEVDALEELRTRLEMERTKLFVNAFDRDDPKRIAAEEQLRIAQAMYAEGIARMESKR